MRKPLSFITSDDTISGQPRFGPIMVGVLELIFRSRPLASQQGRDYPYRERDERAYGHETKVSAFSVVPIETEGQGTAI